MDPSRSELVQGLRAEALALFQANQTGRLAAERAAQLLVTVSGVAVAAAINAKNEDVLLVLPPVVLLLISYMCQQYADVSVLGAARAAIETRLKMELGDHTLIYETLVAGIRQRPPLVRSVRIFQTTIGAVAAGVVVTGLVVALQLRSTLVVLAYIALILATAVSALMSYRDMLQSGDIAAQVIRLALGIDAAE
jgi:hypothetical protein